MIKLTVKLSIKYDGKSVYIRPSVAAAVNRQPVMPLTQSVDVHHYLLAADWE